MARLIIILLITGLCSIPQSGRNKPQPEPSAKTSLDGYSEKQRAALKDAVSALRRLGDAISFGVTFRDYAKRLSEAKSVIEDAESALPDNSIGKDMLAVWKCHIKAFGWWDTLRILDGIPLKSGEVEELLKELPKLKTARSTAATREEILTACWVEAAEKLKPLIDLVK